MDNAAIMASLNEEQKKAVEQTEGPVLINAGAGSGKTRVLTSKIALLMDRGIRPERILALTFTKKAAGEMKKRIRQMTSGDVQRLVMGTFHSVFIRFLRLYAESLGYPENFTIYDEEDSEACLKAATREVIWGPNWEEERKKADEKDKRFSQEKHYTLRYLKSRISLAKNNMYNAEGYLQTPEFIEEDRQEGHPLTGRIFLLYSQKCRLAGAMDFDDILLNTEMLLAQNYEAFRDLSLRFDYILVDEYQDTNLVQYSILRRLTTYNKNICVVGDDCQSIYGFRGAKIDNILNFHRDYPDCRTFRLETNYRSTSQIVDSANRLIANNVNRLPKECRSNKGEGSEIRYKTFDTDKGEAGYVASLIEHNVKRGMINYNDFAVIYRTNAQSRQFEEAFIRNRIPYQIFSGVSFFQRTEVKDTLAYFRLCVNPKDDAAFMRAVARPKRGVGQVAMNALGAFAAMNSQCLYDAVRDPRFAECDIKPKAKEGLLNFVNFIDKIGWNALLEDAASFGQEVIRESGILKYYEDEDEKKGDKRGENILEIVSMLTAFSKEKEEAGDENNLISDFLDDVSLLSNNDMAAEDKDRPCVALMTAHCSKGLEFPYVFVVGTEEKLFPSYREDYITPAALEEERRLFYVAITRAEKTLIVTNAKNRYKYNKLEKTKESRFVQEMFE